MKIPKLGRIRINPVRTLEAIRLVAKLGLDLAGALADQKLTGPELARILADIDAIREAVKKTPAAVEDVDDGEEP